MTTTRHDDPRGIWLGAAAYVVWGLSPLFWNLIDGIGPIPLLVQRTLWALPLLALVITVRRQWPALREGYASLEARVTTTVAAILLATNWGVFLWAVTNDHVVEASLGYFINPLVSVVLGVVVLGERLRRTQWLAVGIATTGVTWMAVQLGTVPWISLTLALTFGTYGLLKKRGVVPPATLSLFGEIAVLSVPAAVALILGGGDEGSTSASTIGTTLFYAASGAITVLPLLLFGAAAKRIRLSTLGLLQYIAPTLQFFVGVVVFGESLESATIVGFVFVWTALAIYTTDMIRSARQPTPTV